MILSIAIPTYNRCKELEETIDSVLGQEAFDDRVELLVSDNCSSDGTEELLRRKYLAAGRRITYLRREGNVGPDANFRLAIEGSSGRWVKLLNDNKPMLPGALGRILDTLERERPSVLLTTCGARYLADYSVTDGVDDFVAAASYNTTWLGGICLEKELWDRIPDKDRGRGKFLIQTYFVYDVLVQRPHAVIDNAELFKDLAPPAARGGYNLFQVFVENYLGILRRLVEEGRLSPAAYRLERRRLLLRFLVSSVARLVESPGDFAFERGGWARIAFRNFRSEPCFYAFPLLVALKLAKHRARASGGEEGRLHKKLRILKRRTKDRLAMLAKGEPKVLRELQGLVVPDVSRPLCVFSSFSRRRVAEYVYHYLAEIQAAGCDIVFVSTSPELDPADIERLCGLCVKLIHRENRGYDFYSWKTGLRLYPDYPRHRGVLLLNDSVVGPFAPFSEILERAESSAYDLVGLTESTDIDWHLQSYFLLVKARPATAALLLAFFARVKPYSYKRTIIERYELGFSALAQKACSVGTLYPSASIPWAQDPGEGKKASLNPTLELWRELIVGRRFPFVKKSLLSEPSVGKGRVGDAIREAGFRYDASLLPGGDHAGRSYFLVIPVYNSEKTLPATLASLERLDEKGRWEILISDDASKDRTREVAAAWIAGPGMAFARAELLANTENLGISGNHAAGFAAASAEYGLYIGGDDFIQNPRLAADLDEALARQPGTRFAKLDLEVLYAGSGRRERLYENRKAFFAMSSRRQYEALALFRNFLYAGPGTLIHLPTLKEIGGGFDPRFRTFEDLPLFYAFLSRGIRMRFLPVRGVVWYRSAASLSKGGFAASGTRFEEELGLARELVAERLGLISPYGRLLLRLRGYPKYFRYLAYALHPSWLRNRLRQSILKKLRLPRRAR